MADLTLSAGGSSLTLTANGETLSFIATGELNAAANVGGASEVFRDKIGSVLNFRTIVAGSGIVVTEVGDTIQIAGGAGAGDVFGPAGATDEAIARYDTTTGKLIQDSLVTVDDSGNFATPGGVVGRGGTFTALNAAAIALIAKGVAAQTAKLQEWQNNASAVVGSVSVLGAAVFADGANALTTTTTSSPVVVAAAAPPSAGQILTALTATTADWQSPAAATVPDPIVPADGTQNITGALEVTTDMTFDPTSAGLADEGVISSGTVFFRGYYDSDSPGAGITATSQDVTLENTMFFSPPSGWGRAKLDVGFPGVLDPAYSFGSRGIFLSAGSVDFFFSELDGSGIIRMMVSDHSVQFRDTTNATRLLMKPALVSVDGNNFATLSAGDSVALRLQGQRPDSASVRAIIIDSVPNLTTAGAKILSVRNANVELFYVDKDGGIQVSGDLDHDGSNVGFYGTAPAAQSAAYTRNATIVEDRTLLASASATTINNNNVLAALIADLQAVGLLA